MPHQNKRPKDDLSHPQIFPRDEHPISRNDIDPDALKIMYRLNRHNFKAYLVGGGVRDLLLKKRPKDFDIATDATPRQVKSLFRNCRIIGRRFKLAHVFFQNGKIIEVATFRDMSDPDDPSSVIDEDPGKFAQDNKYGTEATDALRRDITINALFYDIATFSIIDYIGGMEDLQRGIIRVIGDPGVRFAEDPVRLIRVVRHSARSGFKIEESCRKSIIANAQLIATSSTMRVYEEIKKDLLSGYSLEILRALDEVELLGYLLPELSSPRSNVLTTRHPFSKALNAADALILQGEDVPASVILALMVLFMDGSGEAEPMDRFTTPSSLEEHLSKCFSTLAVPRKERERIYSVVTLWHRALSAAPHWPKVAALARKSFAQDAITLLRCLNWNGQYQDILEALAQPQSAGRESRRGSGRRRRRSSRAPRQ